LLAFVNRFENYEVREGSERRASHQVVDGGGFVHDLDQVVVDILRCVEGNVAWTWIEHRVLFDVAVGVEGEDDSTWFGVRVGAEWTGVVTGFDAWWVYLCVAVDAVHGLFLLSLSFSLP
jgi:hypothetical protein